MFEISKRVFVKSFGCSSNMADGEFLRGCLLKGGFELVNGIEEADILIYNTCAVKSPTENRAIEELKKASKLKKLIVTGCLPFVNLHRLKREVRFDGLLGPAPGPDIIEAVSRVLRGENVQYLDTYAKVKPRLDLPKHIENKVISIVPVAYGCLGSCSYCCVVFARGPLRSCGMGEIVERINNDMRLGAKEIWLTGQDVACYGQDIKQNFVNLLNRVCSIKGDFFVRVGMMTPNYASEILEGLIKAFHDERIFKFLHLPLQSGDNEVLKQMNRLYSVENFQRIIETFRKEFPEATISTDVICGFPNETEEAFERTFAFIEQLKPDIVNVSKFFSRPGTSAHKMKSIVPAQKIAERSKRLAELATRISVKKNRAWINWTGKILIDEIGKNKGSWIGRNFAYKPIVVKSREIILGRFVKVRVIATYRTYLEAEITN